MPKEVVDKLKDLQLGKITTTQVRGVTIATWLSAMLEGSQGWDDRLE